MTGDWRDWRPAIWLTMIGIAVMLVFSPFYVGALFIGAALGSRDPDPSAPAPRRSTILISAPASSEPLRRGVVGGARAAAGAPATARGRSRCPPRIASARAPRPRSAAGSSRAPRPDRARSRACSRSRTTESATTSLYSVAELPQRGPDGACGATATTVTAASSSSASRRATSITAAPARLCSHSTRTRSGDLTDHPAGVAEAEMTSRQVSRDHAAGADHRVRPDAHARTDDNPGWQATRRPRS